MVQPMALTKYDASLTQDWQYAWISEKFDGWRLVYKQGKFYTRSGRVIPLEARFYEEATLFGDVVLDGELWGGYEDSKEGGLLTFQVFDAVFPPDLSEDPGSQNPSSELRFEERVM